ncbi:MAG: hypothetical protein HZB53_16290 [Chloroflexi bacterium]|nr:hypothetical protein [Chloroflexota bacterium]
MTEPIDSQPADTPGTPLAGLDLPDPLPAPVEPVIVERTNWIATIGVGLILLVLGFGAGFSARPLLIPAPAPVVAPPVGGTPGSGGSMLDLIYGSVRHYRGDPKAPVTMLEYSDFQ